MAGIQFLHVGMDQFLFYTYKLEYLIPIENASKTSFGSFGHGFQYGIRPTVILLLDRHDILAFQLDVIVNSVLED